MEGTKEMAQYEQYLIRREVSESTKEIYLREAGRLKEYLQGRAVTKELMVAYKEHVAAQGYAPATQNQHIIAANHYLRFLGYGDCTVRIRRIQRRKSLENVLTMAEYKRLLAYAGKAGNEKYYMIMRTLASTGIRIGELSFFTVEILDREAIEVANKGKIREVCLPASLKKELVSYSGKAGITSGAIFLGNRGKAISRTAVYKMLARLAGRAKVPEKKAHPHNFRHLFALTYMEHYSNLFELADLLGHSDLETTRIYTRNTASEKGRRIDKLGL